MGWRECRPGTRVRITLLALVFTHLIAGKAWPVNLVKVESKSVTTNSTGVQVGVHVTNDIPVTAIVLPLELRSLTGGAYITGPSGSFLFGVVPGNRVGNSPLMGAVMTQQYAAPGPSNCPLHSSGHSYQTVSPVDFVSPDAVLWLGVSSSSPPVLYYLPAGDDAVAGVFSDWPDVGETTPYAAGPSFRFTFNVNGCVGAFEIDTCCVLPANVLAFSDLSANYVRPSFTKGVITIPIAAADAASSNATEYAPCDFCACPCHGDPQCDGVINVQDVVKTVDVAFRGVARVFDPNCPRARTDVNCDDFTTVVDVVKEVNVAFRAAKPTTEFCNPCSP